MAGEDGSKAGGADGGKGVEKAGARRDKRQVSRDVMEKFGHLSQEEACKHLKMSTRTLRKRCRELGLKRWPYQPKKKVGRKRLEVQVNAQSAFTTVAKASAEEQDGKPCPTSQVLSVPRLKDNSEAFKGPARTAGPAASNLVLSVAEKLQLSVLLEESKKFFEAESKARELEKMAEIEGKSKEELLMFCIELQNVMLGDDALKCIRAIDVPTILKIINEAQLRLVHEAYL
ncbi:RWP-RK domain-containing protein [Chloropicon roscoffensis]|uniref:RWP-RK domain-containing protein n=1 Tax=Chloropicon roscoffensis TaxID=1461544 RepID=A0AAX4P751_9CHLO